MKAYLAICLGFCSFLATIKAQNAPIDPKLFEQLKTKTTTDAIVLFKATADVRGISLLDSRVAVKVYVANQLAQTAIESQRRVAHFLNDKAFTFSPYSVVNCMYLPKVNEALLEQLATFEEVKQIVCNVTLHTIEPIAQDDTQLSDRQVIEWGITNIKADAVWARGFTGAGIVVGGADTGYDYNHTAINAKYRGTTTGSHDYNWFNAATTTHFQWGTNVANSCGYNPLTPCDDGDHGTHTMGTMVGSVGANQIGVAPDAKWIGARNMDRGWGLLSWYVACFEWFLRPTPIGVAPSPTTGDPTKAPDVINNSWGCPPPSGGEDCTTATFPVMEAAVNNLENAGVVVVVSAGNSGSNCSTVSDPAAIFQNSFSVGASDIANNIASFSSRGPVTVDGSNRLKPNVSAPGVNVRSCVPGSNTYGSKSGTSMAGPHVAGAVALLLSANNSLSVAQVKTLLETKARKNTTTQTCGGLSTTATPNNTFGAGIIDIDSAVITALTVLPIRIINFGATAKQATIDLAWTTATEEEQGIFWVEKTKDGQTWELVGTLESKGYDGHAYSLTDAFPYRGINYYRLRHVDSDGSAHHGKIINVTFDGRTTAQVRIAPNPTSSTLNIRTEGFTEEFSLLQLFDNQGRMVLKMNIQSNMEYTLSLNDLPKGLYLLNIENVCTKVLKQDE